MTFSQAGIDYICQNFGLNNCCVHQGLSWYYTIEGQDHNETGGTAQVVSRLVLGLIDSLTMVSPDNGTFTQADLNEANGSPVTLQDAQEITHHDEPSEDQWCIGGVPTCEELDNIYECVEIYNCYWYDDSCHSGPKPSFPWWLILIPVAAGIGIIVYLSRKK